MGLLHRPPLVRPLVIASAILLTAAALPQLSSSLELTPSEGPPDTNVGISGTSICPIAFVDVAMVDQTGTVTSVDSGFTDADGNIIASIKAAGEPGPATVIATISNPITQCNDLAQASFLILQAESTVTPSPTLTLTDTLTPSPPLTITLTPPPSPTPTPDASGTPSTAVATPSPSAPVPGLTLTPSPTLPGTTPTPTLTASPSPTGLIPTASILPPITLFPTTAPSLTPTPTATHSPVPPTDTQAPPQPTSTPVPPTDTETPPPTATAIPSPVPTEAAPQPTVEIVSPPVIQTVPTAVPTRTPARTSPASPTPFNTSAPPTGGEIVPLTGSTTGPEHCFVEEFANTTGQRVNGLYVTTRGPIGLSQVYTGPSNPFGPPQSSSGFNALDGTFRLDYRGAVADPGSSVVIGACAQTTRLEFSSREGLPSHFFSWDITPLLDGQTPPAVGFAVEWFTGGERAGTPSGAFILEVFGPWLGRAAAQGEPTARLVLFNTSGDPGSDQLLLSALQVASLRGQPDINDLSWDATGRLEWRNASQTDLLLRSGSSLSLDLRLAPGQAVAWRGLAVYVGPGAHSAAKIVGVVSPALPDQVIDMRLPVLLLLSTALAAGAFGVFLLVRALWVKTWPW